MVSAALLFFDLSEIIGETSCEVVLTTAEWISKKECAVELATAFSSVVVVADDG